MSRRKITLPGEKIKPKIKEAIEEQVRSILDEIAQRREEARAKGLNFTALSEEQIRKKLARKVSPLMVWQSWVGSAPSGLTITYKVGIHNPDPTGQFGIFDHLFIGPANPVSDVGAALSTVDTRFPRLTLPEFDGLSIDPATTKYLSFAIKVPMDIESTNYLGNSFLFRAEWHGVGEYIDRSAFVFRVT